MRTEESRTRGEPVTSVNKRSVRRGEVPSERHNLSHRPRTLRELVHHTHFGVKTMPWIFVAFFALAATFFKLGAISVMAKLLMYGLAVALVLIAGLVIALAWQKISSRGAP